MYKVQKESGDASEKTLHRNMLVPFSVISTISETENTNFPIKNSVQARKPTKSTNEIPANSDSETDSESDDNIFVLPTPSYVIPQRRNYKNKMEQGMQRRIDRSTVSSHRGRIDNVSNNIDGSTAISIQDSRPNMTADSRPNNNVDNSQVSTVLEIHSPQFR